MNKGKFLTLRWNYIISVVQGLPTFLYVIYGLFAPLGDTKAGMIGLSILGALF